MLRHNRTATTTDIYIQQMPEGVRANSAGDLRGAYGVTKPKEAVKEFDTI